MVLPISGEWTHPFRNSKTFSTRGDFANKGVKIGSSEVKDFYPFLCIKHRYMYNTDLQYIHPCCCNCTGWEGTTKRVWETLCQDDTSSCLVLAGMLQRRMRAEAFKSSTIHKEWAIEKASRSPVRGLPLVGGALGTPHGCHHRTEHAHFTFLCTRQWMCGGCRLSQHGPGPQKKVKGSPLSVKCLGFQETQSLPVALLHSGCHPGQLCSALLYWGSFGKVLPLLTVLGSCKVRDAALQCTHDLPHGRATVLPPEPSGPVAKPRAPPTLDSHSLPRAVLYVEGLQHFLIHKTLPGRVKPQLSHSWLSYLWG